MVLNLAFLPPFLGKFFLPYLIADTSIFLNKIFKHSKSIYYTHIKYYTKIIMCTNCTPYSERIGRENRLRTLTLMK
jgi:hypothetical protein